MHPAARRHAHACHTGHLSRREFLTRATALGMSASAAYALIGATPALALTAAALRARSILQQGEASDA